MFPAAAVGIRPRFSAWSNVSSRFERSAPANAKPDHGSQIVTQIDYATFNDGKTAPLSGAVLLEHLIYQMDLLYRTVMAAPKPTVAAIDRAIAQAAHNFDAPGLKALIDQKLGRHQGS